MKNVYHKDGSAPPEDRIFVFGSNLSGIHGGGAARAAHQFYGAEWGVAEGLTGRCYALPTVNKNISGSLYLKDIRENVETFVKVTQEHPELKWFVTRVGCVLAGYTNADIAPMFRGAINCSFAEQWKDY